MIIICFDKKSFSYSLNYSMCLLIQNTILHLVLLVACTTMKVHNACLRCPDMDGYTMKTTHHAIFNAAFYKFSKLSPADSIAASC